MPRHPVVDRTYRREPGPVNYWKEVAYYIGDYVVVYLPHTGRWKRAWLCGLLPNSDEFVIRWRKRGRRHTLRGIWRVHKLSLFSMQREKSRLLPEPLYSDKLLPKPTTKVHEGSNQVATRSSKKADTSAEENGSKPTRTTNDKLEGLTEAKRRNIAKLITRERAKKPATSWPDVTALVKDKYDWDLPGSMTGRRLMREYGPDNAEDAIIKQDRTASPKKTGTKRGKKDPNAEALAGLTRAELKALIKEDEVDVKVLKSMEDEDIRTAILESGWTVEDDEDEEEPEDEEEEDEEPAPKPKPQAKRKPAAKQVAVKRKPKPKPNPSK